MNYLKKVFILVFNIFVLSSCPPAEGWGSLHAQEMMSQEQSQTLPPKLQAFLAQQQSQPKEQSRWNQITQAQNTQKASLLKTKQELLEQEAELKKLPKSDQKTNLEKDFAETKTCNANDIENAELLDVAISIEKQLSTHKDNNDNIEFVDEISMDEMSLYQNQNPEGKSLFDTIDKTKSLLAHAHLVNQLSSKPEDFNALQNNKAKLKKLTTNQTLFDGIENSLDKFLKSENFYLKNLKEKQLNIDYANISNSKNTYSLDAANVTKKAIIQLIIAGLVIAFKERGIILNTGGSVLSKVLELAKKTPIINKLPGLLSKIPGSKKAFNIASFISINAAKLTGGLAVKGLMLLLMSVISIPVAKFIGPQLTFIAPLLATIPVMGPSIIPMLIQGVSGYLLTLGMGHVPAIAGGLGYLATSPKILLGAYGLSEVAGIAKPNSRWSGLLNNCLTAGLILTSPLSMPYTLGIIGTVKTTGFLGKKLINWWRRPSQIMPHIENVQELLNSLEVVNNSIKEDPDFVDLSTEISALINPTELELKTLIKNIRKPKEKYAKNKKLMEQIFEDINTLLTNHKRLVLDAVRATAKVDYFMSLARLFNEHKNTNNKFCLVDYINIENNTTATPHVQFNNLWNPIEPDSNKYNFVSNKKLETGTNSNKMQYIAIATLLAKLGLAPSTTATLTPFSFIRVPVEKQETNDLQEERDLFTGIADTVDIGSQKNEFGLVLLGNSKYRQDPVNMSLFNTVKELYQGTRRSGMGIFA